MSRFSMHYLRVLIGCVAVAAPFLMSQAKAAEFRTTREQVIVYDSPSDHAKRLSILSKDYPVEVLGHDDDGWLNVRDMGGETGWIDESKASSTRKRVIVKNNSAEAMRLADLDSRVAFRADKGVVLEPLSKYPDEDGWLKVRIPNTRQEGFLKSNQVWGIDRKKVMSRVVDDTDRTPTKLVRLKPTDYSTLEEDERYIETDRSSSVNSRAKRAANCHCQVYRGVDNQGRVVYRAVPVRADARRRHATPSYEVVSAAPAKASVVRYYPKKSSVHHIKATTTAKRVRGGDELSEDQAQRLVAAERQRLRLRRLRAEEAARKHNDDSESRRPVIYSKRNLRNSNYRDDWNYSDEERDDVRASVPRVHR